MDYIIGEIFMYLLVAGVVGLIVGAMLRGGCGKKKSKKEIKKEEELVNESEDDKLKISMLQSKLQEIEDDQEVVRNEMRDKHVQEIDRLKEELNKEKMNNTKAFAPKMSINSTPSIDLSAIKNVLAQRKINLSDKLINLYAKYKINFQKSSNLHTNYPVSFIDGISDENVSKLKEININTTNELLLKDNTENIVSILGIAKEEVASWIGMADLLQLPGVDDKVAKLLYFSGVKSIKHFTSINAQDLFNKIVEVNKEQKLVPNIPNVNSLNLWSTIASQI